MNKKFISLVLTIVLILTAICSVYADSGFSDVKSSNWAYTYINQLVEKGGINGYPDKTFRPSKTITAAEFVKITVALLDGEKDKPLLGHWATNYMKAAEVLEIVPEGMFEKSDWDKPIPRQKMGVIMERAAENMLDEIVVTDTAKLDSTKAGIKDYDSICKYCKDYIVQAVLRGLINGYTDGTFKPEQTATRAEASTMIIRLVEPAYRVFTKETAPDPGVVTTGTDLSDYLKNPVDVELLHDIDITKYTVLKDGSKFYLKYMYSDDRSFWVQYKNYGNVFTLDKTGQRISDSNPLNSPVELVKQAFDGKLKDTAYFVFVNGEDDIAYIVPNNLAE
jgi:hypothetical protein